MDGKYVQLSSFDSIQLLKRRISVRTVTIYAVYGEAIRFEGNFRRGFAKFRS